MQSTDQKCKHHSCDRASAYAGWCEAHYLRARQGKDMDKPIQQRARRGRTCDVPGCGRPHEGHGFCHTHLAAYRRGSDPDTFGPIADTHEKRFAQKCTVDADGHWVWNAATAGEGRYGAFQYRGRVMPAHVASWRMFRGPIPEGMVIDHLCRVTLCVNPDHLEPVTQRENILRGDAPPARNAVKTHCIRGHEFTPENTYVMKSGGRSCRACGRVRYQQRRIARSLSAGG